jgi:hypothetical protein
MPSRESDLTWGIRVGRSRGMSVAEAFSERERWLEEREMCVRWGCLCIKELLESKKKKKKKNKQN